MRKGLKPVLGLLGGLLWVGAAAATSLEVTVRDSAGQPLAGAVVVLESPAARRAVQPLESASIAQRGKAFVPSVLVVPRGTPVTFPNQDTVRHHVYSFSEPKRFELKLYLGTPAVPVVFDKAGVVVLGCNIHDDMVAWVVVTDTPYYGTTNESGKVLLSGLPAGDYQLRVWHQRLRDGAPAAQQPHQVSAEPARTTVTLQGLEAP
ncbi:MAG: methylamine utilization protein [Serpentinimonas sp.]|nr:methylamine utilization protein [Serpentinimonas sp.]